MHVWRYVFFHRPNYSDYGGEVNDIRILGLPLCPYVFALTNVVLFPLGIKDPVCVFLLYLPCVFILLKIHSKVYDDDKENREWDTLIKVYYKQHGWLRLYIISALYLLCGWFLFLASLYLL